VTRSRILLAAVAAALALGCRTPTVLGARTDLLARPELAFLHDGVTTRADALLVLGEPAAAFEGERVLTWQLERRGDGSLRVRLPRNGPFEAASWQTSLVLIFGEEGVLARHSVVVVE
jgi:hypothetical protein